MDPIRFKASWDFGTTWTQQTDHWIHTTLGYFDCTEKVAGRLVDKVNHFLHTELPSDCCKRMDKLFKPREVPVWLHSKTSYAGGRFPIVDLSDAVLDKLVDAEDVPDISWENESELDNRARYEYIKTRDAGRRLEMAALCSESLRLSDKCPTRIQRLQNIIAFRTNSRGCENIISGHPAVALRLHAIYEYLKYNANPWESDPIQLRNTYILPAHKHHVSDWGLHRAMLWKPSDFENLTGGGKESEYSVPFELPPGVFDATWRRN